MNVDEFIIDPYKFEELTKDQQSNLIKDAREHEDPLALIRLIIMTRDYIRLQCDGGYPSQYVVENGKVYWATLADGRDNKPELRVRTIEKFMEEYDDGFMEEVFHLEEEEDNER
jgi:hypothetical protein